MGWKEKECKRLGSGWMEWEGKERKLKVGWIERMNKGIKKVNRYEKMEYLCVCALCRMVSRRGRK